MSSPKARHKRTCRHQAVFLNDDKQVGSRKKNTPSTYTLLESGKIGFVLLVDDTTSLLEDQRIEIHAFGPLWVCLSDKIRHIPTVPSRHCSLSDGSFVRSFCGLLLIRSAPAQSAVVVIRVFLWKLCRQARMSRAVAGGPAYRRGLRRRQ